MADGKVVTPPGGDAPNFDGGQDATLVSGQDPENLFGVAISYDTGAQGTSGAAGQSADPTNEPGQYPATEPISGVQLGDTGSPGSSGADPMDRPGEQTVTVTDPNYTAGQPGGGSGNVFRPAQVAVGGGGDTTTMPGQYDSGVSNLPGMAEPAGTGAGKGRVMRGGWMNGKR
jgi:hypothetical protein